MRVVLASSEAVPFSKTGGLADVSSALAKALDRLGHDVWLISPHYPQIPHHSPEAVPPPEPMGPTFEIPIGSKRVIGTLLRSEIPGSGANVVLIEQPVYYGRRQLYGENGEDYRDNCERFIFFSRAVMEAVRKLDLQPDVLHTNDWQTGLVPALLNIEYGEQAGFDGTACVFTIHNLAYQGRFWHWDMLLTGLDWQYFNWRQMEFFDSLNLLKTGVVFSDVITTVSPTYAREIQTAEFGCGLEDVLAHRADDLIGIMNGVDMEVWNPRTDPLIQQNYAADTVVEGKARCKAHLQKLMGLPVRSDVPLLGMISRMSDQKGFDLIADCAEQVLQIDLQLCFLGMGDSESEALVQKLTADHPDKVAAKIGFDEALAHRIEAGADAYLMPSRYEPCGLNQLYSLIYGTVPIVRTVGGLADSVVDASQENLAAGRATGFCFEPYEAKALAEQIRRAVDLYRDRETWMQLVRTGMQQDWSWDESARKYVEVYERAVRTRAQQTTGKVVD